MVLCIESQQIYSPGDCHEIAFLSTFGPWLSPWPIEGEMAVKLIRITI